jgi:TnpA family transposase
MDGEIDDEFEVMFPHKHGHPLSWYEFAESISTENQDIAVAVTKKADAELKQAMSMATRDYDKEQKYVKLEKVEREKAMSSISDITTKVPACGVLGQLDASFVAKMRDFMDKLVDLSALRILYPGNGFVTRKETKDGISTFVVKYLETEAGSRNRTESGIPVSTD